MNAPSGPAALLLKALLLQDCHFKDVTAKSIFWAKDGLVFAGGLTFSNVTTEAIQWDSDGAAVAAGDSDATVLRHKTTPVERPGSVEGLAPGVFPEGRIRQLQSDDTWFERVQQVRSLSRLSRCCTFQCV